MNKKGEGTPQQKHLERIEPDQSIQGINTLDDTVRNEAGRKFFVSQAIQPTVAQGRYNAVTGRYELGPEDRNAHTILTSAVSAQDTDFVITAGETWEILGAGGINNNRATYWFVHYYDGTNVYPLLAVTPSNIAGGAGGVNIMPPRITGNGTIAVRVHSSTYIAADGTFVSMVYRRVA